VPVSSSSRVDFVDGAGAGSPGLFAITNLEVYGGTATVDGHTVTQPRIFSADPMGGRKSSVDGFTMARSTVTSINFGNVDRSFQTIGAGPESGSGVGGWIDYGASRVVVQGVIYASVPDLGTTMEVVFNLYFNFTPPPRPAMVVSRVEYGQYVQFDASQSVPPQGEQNIDFVWYRGNQMLRNGFLDPVDILGYGPTINVTPGSMGNESVVTAYIATDGHHVAVATRCYWTKSTTLCYPNDQ
jgi:hypothetical protein